MNLSLILLLMNLSHQDKVIRELADKHGLSYKQACDILNCFADCIVNVMVNPTIDEEGNPQYKIIHIDRFGKFIPNKWKIKKLIELKQTKLKKTTDES
jgi:hypothetical protein